METLLPGKIIHHDIMNYTPCTIFDIIATDVETFIVVYNQLEETTMPCDGRNCRTACYTLAFGIYVPREAAFNAIEHIKVWWDKIGTVGRVIQSFPFERANLIFYESCCLPIELSLGTSHPKQYWGEIGSAKFLWITGHQV